MKPGIVRVTVTPEGAKPREFEVLTRSPQLVAAEFLKNVQLAGDFTVSTKVVQQGGGSDGPSLEDVMKRVLGGVQG